MKNIAILVPWILLFLASAFAAAGQNNPDFRLRAERCDTWNIDEERWDNPDSVEYTYNGAGRPIEVVHRTEGTTWKQTRRELCQYDPQGLLLVKTFQTWLWPQNSWVDEKRQLSAYNDQQGLMEQIEQNWDTYTSGWLKAHRLALTYNAQGQEIEQINQYWNPDSGLWDDYERLEKTYYPNGLLQDEKLFASFLQWGILYQNIYSYDAQNRPLQKITLVADGNIGSQPDTTIRLDYSYNPAGQLTGTVQQQLIDGLWTDHFIRHFTYNAEGRLQEEAAIGLECNDLGCFLVNDYQYKYEYDATGNNTYMLYSLWENEAWRPQKQCFYYWETTVDAPALPPAPTVSIFPNPARDVVTVQYDGPAPERMEIYNAQGRSVRHISEPADRVSTDGLAAGSYLLLLRWADGRAASRTISIQR